MQCEFLVPTYINDASRLSSDSAWLDGLCDRASVAAAGVLQARGITYDRALRGLCSRIGSIDKDDADYVVDDDAADAYEAAEEAANAAVADELGRYPGYAIHLGSQ